MINMKEYADLKNKVNNHISIEILKYKVGEFKLVNLLKLRYGVYYNKSREEVE